MNDDYLERHYPFEGCFNFRDIGGDLNQQGKRIKKGIYFRTGRKDRMSDKEETHYFDGEERKRFY